MPANLENLAVATGLEKVSFHSNPKERQCQRILKGKRGESNCGAEVITAISYLCFQKKLDVVKILSANIVYYGRI